MPFTKNDKNINTQGRKKGVPNKTTAEVKTLLINVFESNLSKIDKQQDKLTLNERITLNKTLLSYILPTIKHEQSSEFIEQPLFPDIITEDMVDEQKPFDIKDLFRIDEFKA
jgi:hypothetical protein